MKFNVNGTELNSILSTVIKGFNPKEDNSYVAFKLDEAAGELTITSRSRATYFKGSLKAQAVEIDAGEPSIYLLDGNKLKQLVSILPSAPVPVSFEINDNTRSFTIKTAASKYKLPVLSETPLASTPEIVEYTTVDAVELMNVLKNLVKIVSTDPSTQEHQISCMHFNLDNDVVTLSATDSYAFGSVKIDSDAVDLSGVKDVLIRHTEVATLIESFAAGETLTLVGSDDTFGYVDENGTISLVGVINMIPLDTSQIEAITEQENVVKVDKGELREAVETVAKLSPSNETVDLDLSAVDGGVRVSNKYGDYIDVAVEESVLNSPGVASFSTSILLKAITPANSGPLKLEFGNLAIEAPGAVRIVSLHADDSVDTRTSLLATRMGG